MPQKKEILIENFYIRKKSNFSITLTTNYLGMRFQFVDYYQREEFFSYLEKWCVRKGGLDLNYELLTRISKGGFGTVYKARRKVDTVNGMHYKLASDINPQTGMRNLSNVEYDRLDENCQIVALKMIDKKRIRSQKNYVRFKPF
jgi:serine/threonine protein kinase